MRITVTQLWIFIVLTLFKFAKYSDLYLTFDIEIIPLKLLAIFSSFIKIYNFIDRSMVQQHPLLMYPVLARIGSYLKFPELLTLRHVCSEWKCEADLRLQNKIQITLNFEENLTRFVKDVAEYSFGENLNVAFFTLNGIDLDSSSCHEAVKDLFKKFGPQIIHLNLQNCAWRSSTLRQILFKQLPKLMILEMSTDQNASSWLQPLLPMSFVPYGSFSPLVSLRELKISGDYSHRTDLFYDVLKSSPNLEIILLSKYHPENDDLFGTWLLEIILSCDFHHLKSLEVDCTIIQLQIDSLALKEFPLKRLSIDLDTYSVLEAKSIDKIMAHFPLLESVEFGLKPMNNIPNSIVNSIIQKFKCYKCWIAIHTFSGGSKIIFPNHEYVLES